uniref:Putative secreted protein n=1 Tax=Anopheles marajoara TaxID=58244 RepID=A0A2M4CEX7_9DIPT
MHRTVTVRRRVMVAASLSISHRTTGCPPSRFSCMTRCARLWCNFLLDLNGFRLRVDFHLRHIRAIIRL